MNWGKSIVIVYVIFVFGMGYLVYRSTQEVFEVVDVDYYQREKEFSSQLDAKNNANKKGLVPFVEQSTSIQRVVIPTGMNQEFKGSIFAYCPTKKEFDTLIPIKSFSACPDSSIKVDLSALKSAKYILKISWSIDKEQYFSEIEYLR